MDKNQAIGMLTTMARMQEEHNCQVHAEWRSQGYEYYRAIWVECAEMLDHYGWKWWKKQAPDLSQVKLELVDIWHFALSELLRGGHLDDEVGLTLAAVDAGSGDPAGFRRAIEALAASSLNTRSFELQPFVDAMRALPMAYEELFDFYVGKNVLNQLRQNHGYQSGAYVKTWDGREDNEHLVEILDSLEAAPAELPDVLYRVLEDRYLSFNASRAS